MQATGNITAWKHIHIEKDKMCRKGGILKQDAAQGWQVVYLAMNQDSSIADNVSINDIIHIFDSERHIDVDHDIKCLKTRTEDVGNKRTIIELANKDNCAQVEGLDYAYDADDNGDESDTWDFNSGKSAGVCVEGSGFHEADTSDLRQPFNDTFVSFHIPMQVENGAGEVPYLPQIWFKNTAFSGVHP